eukprot:362077-Chlamydomonas_euryale.AAC.4
MGQGLQLVATVARRVDLYKHHDRHKHICPMLHSLPLPHTRNNRAQVHKAVLKASGKGVVLKVLKPGVEDILATDMSAVYLMSRYLEFIQPEMSRLSLTGLETRVGQWKQYRNRKKGEGEGLIARNAVGRQLAYVPYVRSMCAHRCTVPVWMRSMLRAEG